MFPRERREWWIAMKDLVEMPLSTQAVQRFFALFQKLSTLRASGIPDGSTHKFYMADDLSGFFRGEKSQLVADVDNSVPINEPELPEESSDDDDYDEYGRSKRPRIEESDNIDIDLDIVQFIHIYLSFYFTSFHHAGFNPNVLIKMVCKWCYLVLRIRTTFQPKIYLRQMNTIVYQRISGRGSQVIGEGKKKEKKKKRIKEEKQSAELTQ